MKRVIRCYQLPLLYLFITSVVGICPPAFGIKIMQVINNRLCLYLVAGSWFEKNVIVQKKRIKSLIVSRKKIILFSGVSWSGFVQHMVSHVLYFSFYFTPKQGRHLVESFLVEIVGTFSVS